MALLLDITRDARYGARLLLRNPGSSAVAIVTLAVGIGDTSGVFTVVNAVLFRPLPSQMRGVNQGVGSGPAGRIGNDPR